MSNTRNTMGLSLLITFVAVVMLAVGLVPMTAAKVLAGTRSLQVQNQLGGVFLCSASITYLSQSGTVETYQKDFEVSAGSQFVDDFSTQTREHVFTANATSDAQGVVIDIDYFSDVTALNAIDLATSVTIQPNQNQQTANGTHQFFSSTAGSYTIEYAIVCRRK